MSPLVENSDVVLQMIWQSTIVLALASVAVLFLLIVCRYHSEWRKRHKDRLREELSRYFYAAISSPDSVRESSLPAVKRRNMDVVCSIALDMLRAVKGGDSDRILALLDVWQIQGYLLQALEKGRRGEKIQSLTLLSLFGGEENLRVLLKHAESDDTYVQLAALRGIATQYDTGHVETVVEILSRTESTNRLMLADILRHFGEEAALPLARLARNAEQIDVRVSALMALGMIHPLSAVSAILPLLQDANEDVRAQTAKALGEMGDIRTGAALARALTDNSVGVRVQAAQALGRLRDEGALSALAERLGDENWWVGFRAAEALVRIGDKGISLLRSLSGRQDAVGVMSMQVLAEMAEA